MRSLAASAAASIDCCSAWAWPVIATSADTASAMKALTLLLRHLAERALPVFDMIGAGNLATFDRMHIDRHELERLAVGCRPHEIAGRRASRLATDDDP